MSWRYSTGPNCDSIGLGPCLLLAPLHKMQALCDDEGLVGHVCASSFDLT